jgi:hypothetical protein
MIDYISKFESYILNENNIENYLKYKLKIEKKDIIEKKDNKNYITQKNNDIKFNNKSLLFIPKEQDTLFWCYYIIKNGDIKYETLNNRNILTTKQLKIDYVSKIRENKQIIKTYKFDTITNIENNLANDDNINIKTIISLCAIENINVIFVSKKTYFEFLINDTNDIYIIREIEQQSKYKKKYGFEIANNEILEEIRNTLYKIDTIDKPIKGLSSYKVADLINIANKLAIETINTNTGKSKSKNEIYESLIQYF